MKPAAREVVVSSMSTQEFGARSQLFSPLARALFDRFSEAVILFDPDGHMTYANRSGRDVLDGLASGDGLDTKTLLPRLGRMGGRVERLGSGELLLGHAVYLPTAKPSDTLADHERDMIVGTLNATGWRLTETARRLGISRTTLWRRLREWGVEAPGVTEES
jgi:transcriptional regulator of acetoin/glycerol metabolism